MPATAALTEFNRNPNALLEELKRTQKPTYLTKNGKACAVIMDADAFDRMMSATEANLEREQRVYDGILRGLEDFQNGNASPAKDALASLRARKGW